MRDLIIGIDPGSKGVACIFYTSKLEREWVEISDTDKLLRLFKAASMVDSVVVIEEVHAIHGSSAKATFQFGYNIGMIHGMLKAMHLPYVLIPPKKWQNEMWCSSDKRWGTPLKPSRKLDTKTTSLNAAKRLLPDIDWRRTDKCKNPDDNKVDATLICEYARRKNL